MADFRNKYARVLDVQTWKEVREIVLSNGERIELKQIGGHYVVDAEVAYSYRLHKESRYSLRCTGTAFVFKEGRCQCNAELYPYKILVDGESRYYLRANKNHDDGKDGMVGKEGLYKGHLRLCPFGFEADSKISKEWSYCYEVKESSMMDSIEECRNLRLQKTTLNCAAKGNDSSGRGEKAEKGDRGSENKPVEETMFVTEEKKTEPKSAKDFWASSVNLSGDISIIGKKVMTHRNYTSFREGKCNLSGALTIMAGLSPSYKDYKELIIEQHKDLAKLFGDQTLDHKIDYYSEQIKKYVDSENFSKVNELKKKKKDLIERTKNKIVILEDPFLGNDSIIIVLIDKLPPKGGWRHLTRRKIDADTLMDFVVGGYSWEDVKDDNGKKKKQKVFHNATAPFFLVMCNWEERILTVDGKYRKMVVGSVYALGRQIEYFLENDLAICKSKLRFTGYKNYQVK